MRNLTALTLALTLALALTNPNAHANDGKAKPKNEETLLTVECKNGRWEITYAKNQEVIRQTQADKLQGQPCYNQKEGGKKP
jgi:hypothetical protein